MKAIVATLAAAGMAVVFSLPAKAEGTVTTNGASNSAAQVGNTDVSSQRRHYRRHYGHRYRPYAYRGQRYGYYRPYRYSRPYYAPGVSLGFWGGPRFGVWF